jgi:hypothetical protein
MITIKYLLLIFAILLGIAECLPTPTKTPKTTTTPAPAPNSNKNTKPPANINSGGNNNNKKAGGNNNNQNAGGNNNNNRNGGGNNNNNRGSNGSNGGSRPIRNIEGGHGGIDTKATAAMAKESGLNSKTLNLGGQNGVQNRGGQGSNAGGGGGGRGGGVSAASPLTPSSAIRGALGAVGEAVKHNVEGGLRGTGNQLAKSVLDGSASVAKTKSILGNEFHDVAKGIGRDLGQSATSMASDGIASAGRVAQTRIGKSVPVTPQRPVDGTILMEGY